MSTPKRLICDIETSPNVGLFWSAGYKQKIDYDNIIKERAVICICYKWQGDKKVYSLQWDAKQDDKKMLKEFASILEEADEIVAHNGDKFDITWIRTRCLFHGISLPPELKSIDTLKVARSKFRFNSNRLDYIAKYLGLGQKIHTTYGLWKDIVLNKGVKSMNYMIKYCKGDVVLLEKVFLKLNNHIPVKMHHGILQGGKRHSCPECGGYNVIINKTRTTATGRKKYCVSCKDCGKYHTISENEIKYYA